MKYLFTAPRFHTNQVPIVKGLKDMGHEVKYFVAYIGLTENHTYCEPLVIPPSKTTIRERKKLERTEKQSRIESIISGHFIPDYQTLRARFIEYMPEIVICRDKTNFTLIVYALCREYNIPCILYDQEPLYDFSAGANTNTYIKQDKKAPIVYRIKNKAIKIVHSDLRRINRYKSTIGFPDIRMTPVKYRHIPNELVGKLSDKCDKSFYIPLVYSITESLRTKEHHMEIVKFICVAKYREYKNLPLLIEAVSKLDYDLKWELTIVGQADATDEQQYQTDLQNQITRLKLSDSIKLLSAVDYTEMDSIYKQHDVLVLPSKRETYGMAVTEAMANGLAIIVSDACGVSFNVIESQCGIVFETENVDSLTNALSSIIINKERIPQFGEKAKQFILSEQSFTRYYERLSEIILEAKLTC